MNVFRSPAAPYIFALLASVLGWLATSISKEFSERPTVLYAIMIEDNKSRLDLKNISLRSSISDLNFMVTCYNQSSNCLAPDKEGTYAQIVVFSPLFSNEISIDGASNSSQLLGKVSLLPNSRVAFDFLASAHEELAFFYTPVNTPEDDIIFIEWRGPVAWFLNNYMRNLFVATVVCAVIFVIAVFLNLGGMIYDWWRKGRDRHADEYDVTLRFAEPEHDSLGRRDG